MEKNIDFNSFDMNFDPNSIDNIYRDPMFNPMLQYEQAYMYYRYMSQQMDYKIKCKEYDRLCGRDKERKIE